MATNEAINVLVGALDTDIASAQAAAEAQLQNLLRRDRLGEAAAVARDARIRSIQYGTEVRRVIADTKRDVRRAGWSGDVPARLTEIIALEERVELEQRMLGSLRERRDNADRDDLAAKASHLIDVVSDCMNRHRELHNLVLEAEDTFYTEQHRQAFLPGVHLRSVDLVDELLGPMLAATIEDAATIVPAFSESAWGLVVPRIARLEALVHMLLADAREVDADGVPLPDHPLDDPADDARRFCPKVWAEADRVLASCAEAPRRLSSLLTEARRIGADGTVDLVALRALQAFDPALGRPRAGEVVLAAVDDGALLEDQDWNGADLLVGVVTVDGERLRQSGRGEAS